jgi:N4-gp56 family major capsid protein
MAGVTTTTQIADQYQKYFSRELLKYPVQQLRLGDYGMKAALPKRTGSNTIRWFQNGAPATTDVATLSEGTPIAAAAYRQLSQSYVEKALVQYGEVIQVNDVMSMTEFFDSTKQAVKTLGEDIALHADTLILTEIKAGTTKRYAQGTADFATLIAATAANAKIVAPDLLDACTRLKINRAPTIGGYYVMVAPPQVTRDLMNHADWLEAKKYSDVKDLYKGEVGSLHGVRVVESTNAWTEDETEGTLATSFSAAGTNTTGFVYASFIIGQGFYGIPELSGESPFSPSVVISDKADKSDPLNQKKLIGSKWFWGAKLLNNSYGVVLRSKTAWA